jgi:hypothetical protein
MRPRLPVLVSNQHGAILVVTLIVLVALAGVIAAMMTNTGADRLSSRSVANQYKAQLAAASGVEVARARLAELLKERPYHAFGYSVQNQTPYPVFYGAKNYNAVPEQFYLISSPELEASEDLPFPLNNETVDINVFNEAEDSAGWLGTARVKNIEKDIWTRVKPLARVPWIYILADSSKPNQPDPGNADYNPYVGRTAFWVEDESAKLDVNLVGNTDAAGAFRRDIIFEKDPNDPLATVRQLDLGALPLQAGLPVASGADGVIVNSNAHRHIQSSKHITAGQRSLAFLKGIEYDDVRFHATTGSKSNELAGTGKRRVNINALVGDSANADVIAAQLDDIIFVITGGHVFADSDFHDIRAGGAKFADAGAPGPMPDFGRRFYTTPSLQNGVELRDNHADVYMIKLAANIRDYIDSDSQPTFVDVEGEVIAGDGIKPWKTKNDGTTRPRSWLAGQEPIALGKEAIPYLQEHAWHGRFVNLEKGVGATDRIVSFTLDHYLELYNPSTKTWVAPEGTRITLSNFPEFDAGTHPSVAVDDIELDISNVEFPAGQVVVITTAPEDQQPEALIAANAIVRRPGDGLEFVRGEREFNNKLCNQSIGSSPTRRGLRIRGRANSGLALDYESEYVMSTPTALVDAFPTLTLFGTGSPFEMSLHTTDPTIGTWVQLTEDERLKTRYAFVSYLRGNDSASRSGDPRSLSEQLEINVGSLSTMGNDVTQLFGMYDGNNTAHRTAGLPGDSSLGAPQISFVAPANWPDYHVPLSNSSATAYAVVADGPMKSIGELGHIYDPHRKLGDALGTDQRRINRARGGGRTLKVGQPDDLVGGSTAARFTPPSTSSVGWFNGAWRLADIFSAEPGRSSADVVSEPTARGKININGVLRDGGTAFRAALRAFVFSPAPDGDERRSDRALAETEIDELIVQLQAYLSENGPMMCRGELSQLAFFQAAGASGTAGGSPSSTTIDRGREEIFRRVVELITTRGLNFTVFAVGQALRQSPNGDISVLSSARQEVILEFDPVIGENSNDTVSEYTNVITHRMEM